MDIGYITPVPPYPPNEGARIVAYNHLTRLAERGHQIHLFSTVDEERPVPPELSNICIESEFVVRDRGLATYLRGGKVPYSVQSRHLDVITNRLENLVKRGELDVVLAEHTHVSRYLSDVEVPSCLYVHNLEYESLLSSARSLFPSPVAFPYLVDVVRMWDYERSVFRDVSCDSFAFLSKSELESVSDWTPSTQGRTWHSPVGVDPTRFETAHIPRAYQQIGPTIVFTGTMRYPPNVEAVIWFANEVFPTIRTQCPNAQFFVVGKSPTDDVKRLSDVPGVTVTGPVEEVEPYVAHADVSVIPLKQGTGIQIKLLEALAAGNLVVSTSVGIDGTEVADGEHLLVADSPAAFADAVVDATQNPDKYNELRNRARTLVEEKYDWEAIVDRLETTLQNIVDET